MPFGVGAKAYKVAKLVAVYGIAVGMIFTGGVWFASTLDPYIATEEEVLYIDSMSMKEHKNDVDNRPYAMKDDVNHLLNAMIEEKIKDAENDIKAIEDREDDGVATSRDLRKKERLLKDIEEYKEEFVPERRHTHD